MSPTFSPRKNQTVRNSAILQMSVRNFALLENPRTHCELVIETADKFAAIQLQDAICLHILLCVPHVIILVLSMHMHEALMGFSGAAIHVNL